MFRKHIIRAWKSHRQRANPGQVALSTLPEQPAGAIELTDAELAEAVGGHGYKRHYGHRYRRWHGKHHHYPRRHCYGHHHHHHYYKPYHGKHW